MELCKFYSEKLRFLLTKANKGVTLRTKIKTKEAKRMVKLTRFQLNNTFFHAGGFIC